MRRFLVVVVGVLLSASLITGCTLEQQKAGAELFMSLDPTQQVLLATLEADTGSLSGELATTQGQGAVVTKVQDTAAMGVWEIEYFTGATQMMKDFVFTDPDRTWAAFPNVDWPDANFEAGNGLEYGKTIDEYCQQDETCDIVVSARSYRLITGDYDIVGIGQCAEAGTGVGCAVMLFNVGDVTASLEDQRVDAGFTITGLYWNGDENDQAISALASHTAYRMIGVPSGNPASPGANCSVPSGCKGVDITFGILSGNELLVRGHTVVD